VLVHFSSASCSVISAIAKSRVADSMDIAEMLDLSPVIWSASRQDSGGSIVADRDYFRAPIPSPSRDIGGVARAAQKLGSLPDERPWLIASFSS
jgi:hypothetical protein